MLIDKEGQVNSLQGQLEEMRKQREGAHVSELYARDRLLFHRQMSLLGGIIDTVGKFRQEAHNENRRLEAFAYERVIKLLDEQMAILRSEDK